MDVPVYALWVVTPCVLIGGRQLYVATGHPLQGSVVYRITCGTYNERETELFYI